MNTHPSSLIPTEADHFKVRYARWLGFSLLPIGILNLLLVAWVILLESKFNSGIITGILCTACGYLYCTRPYFALAPNRLTIYNLIGSAVKRYPFADFQDLKIEGKQLYIATSESGVDNTSQTEKVKITKWLIRSSDWKKLEMIISANKTQTQR